MFCKQTFSIELDLKINGKRGVVYILIVTLATSIGLEK